MKGKHYIVIDTNVLVSALITKNENSPTVKILHFIADNKIIPVYSEEIIKEYSEVLKRDKFKLPEEIRKSILNDIISNGLEIANLLEVKEKMIDPKDVVFYSVTLSSSDKKSVLVTGNGKHFPVKPFVLTPAQLVKIIE